MAKSNIEWTERVWNPLTGCTRKGQGCVHCYAERMSKRLAAMGRPEYQNVINAKGNWTGTINLLFERLDQPLRWKKPATIFVNSMSDLFHEAVNAIFINRVFDVMNDAHWHTYQILTKRYNRLPYVLTSKPAPHIWVGYSICNQADADNARDHLAALSAQGWNTWVSYEPAVGLIDWTGYEHIKWMVCGGETGPGSRPMITSWARSARDWSTRNQIPFYFKQWGDWGPCLGDTGAQRDDMVKLGKKKTGRTLDGIIWDQYPPSIKEQ